MARYAIYSTNTGTSTARPVLGLIEIPDEPASTFAARLAAQPLNANEALLEIQESASLTDQNSETNTNDFTVNSTATPPVALTAVSVARFSLQQRQAQYRARRDTLIMEATARANFGRFFTETEGENWFSYLKALQDLSDEPANPEGVSFPSAPGELGGTGGIPLFSRLWRRSNTIGSVAKVAGVPVQQLVEYETTANGYYWKWTDGILLCTHRLQFNYSSAAQLAATWTFPHAFGNAAIGRRSVNIVMSTRGPDNEVLGIGATAMASLQPMTNSSGTTNSISLLLRHPTNGLVSGDFCWGEVFAMGRWDN
jgi:Tfp pilus assembly protein PilV